ncbi:MAG: N-acetylneuraminate synthase family protein [Candidatus Colwellbacteria bacterium]|nr:N-acetylneuraminate synthase family protein [Candidatus Colwellbacteria bacterium]
MSKVRVIAEAGCNHGGDRTAIEKMVIAAADAGADFIKFQLYQADRLVGADPEVVRWCRQCQLDEDLCKAIIALGLIHSIQPLFSVFDSPSLQLACKLEMPIIKVPSGQAFNPDLLREIGATRKKIFLSIGMCTTIDYIMATKYLVEGGAAKENITIFQCNTAYPSPLRDAHLRTITMIKNLGWAAGYSDHTRGSLCAIGAVCMGAEIIEKHFTLDKTGPGPDQCVSLDPKELKYYIRDINDIQEALGDRMIQVTPSEAPMLKRRDYGNSAPQKNT